MHGIISSSSSVRLNAHCSHILNCAELSTSFTMTIPDIIVAGGVYTFIDT